MSLTKSRCLAAGTLAALLWLAPFAVPQKADPAAVQFEAASKKELVDGDLKAAIGLYSKLVQNANRVIAAKALVQMGQCQEKLGQADARKAYEQTIREFPDQKEAVATARARLDKMIGSAEKGIVARQASAMLHNRIFGPAISQDGRYLAFTNNGNLGIYDLSAETTREVARKPSPEAGLYNPLISPDGRYVAYLRVESPNANGLYVIGSDGTNPRRLAGGNNLTAVPWDWAPDGRHLLAAFRSSDKGPQVAMVSVADGSSRIIASRANAGRIAPDGRHVALVRGAEVFMVSVEGGNEVRLAAGQYWEPVWTPDGKRLLVVSNRRGQSDLWSIPVVNGAAGGPPEFVKDNVQGLLGATRDGQYYYQLRTQSRDLFVAEIDPQTGALRSPPKQITSSDLNAGAAWSPDGEFLAYYAFRGTQGARRLTVVIRTYRSGEERELLLKEPLNPSVGMPQWFPDSRSLFVHSQNGKLSRLDVQTGEFRPLLDPATILLYRDGRPNSYTESNVILSPNGRSIYYLARDSDAHRTRILRQDLDGGVAVEVCRMVTDGVFGFSISPDGSRIVFSNPSPVPGAGAKGSLWTVPTTGGEPKEVYRSTNQWLHDPVWSRDGGRLLVFCDYRGGDILIIPAEGGEAKLMGVGLHEKYFLSVHPDGNQIVFADEQFDNRLWVLKNLFGDAKANR